jgi:hypothetical protein
MRDELKKELRAEMEAEAYKKKGKRGRPPKVQPQAQEAG